MFPGWNGHLKNKRKEKYTCLCETGGRKAIQKRPQQTTTKTGGEKKKEGSTKQIFNDSKFRGGGVVTEGVKCNGTSVHEKGGEKGEVKGETKGKEKLPIR